MLRNKLLEDDRPELAVEVSTKCNLDTQSVWLAWAKACFMSGQYVAAREKLSHCWKVRESVIYNPCVRFPVHLALCLFKKNSCLIWRIRK